MTIDRLTTREDFERCIAANADDPIFLLKHSTT